mgnify:CR=1 FL=1|tara:strand:- start:91 stop:1071 length:981 start_codon:yes stop_codon:yes gene_type:complete
MPHFILMGQDSDLQVVLSNEGHDTTYIKDFHEKLIVKTYIVSKANNFSVTDVKNEITTDFKPNDVTNLGFGLNYKSFGVSIAFIPLGNKDNEKYGRTRKLDLQANMYTRRMGFDMRFQYYKGFYIDNASNIDPDLELDTLIPVRADISTLAYGGNIFYVFNNKTFSFKNTFTNNEWQIKSAGTFYAGSSLSGFNLSADSIIGPTEIIDTLKKDDYYESLSAVSIGGFGGYAYTYVMAKKFYMTMAIAPGLATVLLKATDGLGNQVKNNSRLAFKLNARMGIGYNSEKIFAGVSAFWDYSQFSYGENEGRIDFTTGSIRLYFGVRFL